MRLSEIRRNYEHMAIRGTIQESQVGAATMMTVLAAGRKAFYEGYYGSKAWAEAMDSARKLKHESEELAGQMLESVNMEVGQHRRILEAAHTTTDFPLALAQVRDRVRRASYNPIESNIAAIATRRTANDFKLLRGIQTDTISRLKLRSEGASVSYASFGSTEDKYSVANWELAIGYTWEAYVNDDIDEFVTALASLGVAARRNRGLVIFEAIRDGTSRLTPSGTTPEGTAAAGGPTPANVVWAHDQLAAMTNANSEPIARMLSDIYIPARWRVTAKNTLTSQYVVSGNTTARTAKNSAEGLARQNDEPAMVEVMGAGGGGNAADWLASDNTNPWLEFATLAGFEGGPRTFTKMPDVVETNDLGSFDNHTFAVKVSDAIGAKVTDAKSILRIAGA
jgi:hypothetical protein